MSNRVTIVSILGGLLTAGFSFILSTDQAVGLIAGYLLAMGAVAGHFIIVWFVKKTESDRFIERYYRGIAIRFLLVLALFAAILRVTNIDLIFFTLSFIISYIFHSVIEIILVNKAIIKKSL